MGCGERERSDRVSGNTEKHKENIGHSEGEREREKTFPTALHPPDTQTFLLLQTEGAICF